MISFVLRRENHFSIIDDNLSVVIISFWFIINIQVSTNYLLAIGNCFGFFLDFFGLLDLLFILQYGQIGAFL